MATARTPAIALRVHDYGESDKLITFYSPDLGRFTAIAKGAKRSKQRFVNKLELFSHLQLLYRPSRQSSLFFLEEAELENAFLSLRQDYRRYTAAIYICELVLRFSKEQDREPRLFNLLTWAFSSLHHNRSALPVAALFHLQLLEIAGYQPGLHRCAWCKGEIGTQQRSVLPINGTMLICESCHKKRGITEPDLHLSIQTIKFLQWAQDCAPQHLARLQLPEQVARQALLFLHNYSLAILQQDLNAWPHLMQLDSSARSIINRGNRSPRHIR